MAGPRLVHEALHIGAPGGIALHTISRPELLCRGQNMFLLVLTVRPQQDSNLRSRLRRPLLSPLSYEGLGLRKVTSPNGPVAQPAGGMAIAQTSARSARVSTERTSTFPVQAVAGTAAETLPSRPWRRDWDACSWWTTMR